MEGLEMLKDAIDMHLHPGPSIQLRRMDFLQMAKSAAEVGLKGIVFKPSEFCSMDRAYAAEKVTQGIKVFGGIVLDNFVGGLNPHAVDVAIKRNAKFIYMPVFDALHTRKRTELVPVYKALVDKEKPSITIFDSERRLKPEVLKIIEIISKAKDVVLATSHLSPEESIALTDEAKSKGVKYVVITHATATIVGATIEQQKEMVEKGAIIEHVWSCCLPRPERQGQNPAEIAEAIKAIGAKHCVLGTDMGNYYHHPIEGFRSFILTMKGLGISDEEIDIMTKENPARILGM